MDDATAFIPRRHGIDVAAGRHTGRFLRRLIRGEAEPSAARWRQLGEGLMQGDPLVDEVVAWMHTTGVSTAMRQFERALEHGIDAVPAAAPALRALFETCAQRPAWLDDALLARGAAVSQRLGMTSHYVLRDVSLMGGYQAAAFNQTLILTGALKGGTPRRIAETMKWVVAVTATDGMARGAEGYRATLHVRLIHALIRHRVAALPQWRSEELGLPINQTDMAATWLGFSALQLIGVRVMGVPLTVREAHAVMHLWKYIAWLMGVDEAWLTDDEMEGRRLLYHMLIAQNPPDATSAQLGRALMEETLAVPYPGWRWLRRRFEQSRHLSVTRLFVGRAGMRALGLPTIVPPWYPLLSAPFTFAWHSLHRVLPGGAERARRIGRKAHEDLLQLHFARSGRPQVRPLQDI